MDRLVYDLYGLMGEEIGIAEASMSRPDGAERE